MTCETRKRDLGIDLLRLFAMGLIILHHLLNHGGLLFAFPTFSASGMAMHLLNAFARCAVNTYALISGYVMVTSRFRPSRLIGLWLQVVFYGVVAVLCLPLMAPGSSAGLGDWICAVMPVSHNNYWYFTCYAAVFCLSPALNLLLRQMSKRQTGLLMAALIAVFSVLPMVTLNDPFQLQNGYHFGWLLILYLLGGAIHLHGFGKPARKRSALIVFILCGVLGWASRLGIIALGADWLHELLLHYTAPTMLLCGIALLRLFKGLKLPAWLGKAVSVLSPLSFGVYLIHDNPLVRKHLVSMRMTALAGLNPVLLLAGLAACWAVVYAVCLIIEWLRTKLFAALHVPALCGRAEKRLVEWADRLFPPADA